MWEQPDQATGGCGSAQHSLASYVKAVVSAARGGRGGRRGLAQKDSVPTKQTTNDEVGSPPVPKDWDCITEEAVQRFDNPGRCTKACHNCHL